jgi:hypothetical protein
MRFVPAFTDPEGRNEVAAAGRARKFHVIPANAGIQEATSLAVSHAFGSDERPRLAPPHRGLWIPAFAGMTN